MKRILAICLVLSAPAAAEVAQPAGFRDAPYRAPVPDALDGATVVATDAAHDLWTADAALFVDVLPQPPKPDNLPEGTVWRDREHASIPGAVWMPNVGYADLAPSMEAYFRDGLKRATDGDRERAVLFFCKAECWMSWNAAKRAIGYGYTDVYWMPDGTDGWTASGHELEPVLPMDGHP